MKIKIDVTEEDIKLGCRGSFSACPIVRAAQRATGIERVEVTEYDMYINPSGQNAVVYELPDEAKDFIKAYDNEEDVAPFSFEVGFEKGEGR